MIEAYEENGVGLYKGLGHFPFSDTYEDQFPAHLLTIASYPKFASERLTLAKRGFRTAQMRLVFIIPMVVARLCTLAIAGDVENRTGTGTIVVFNASKDQIVVAADSRTSFLVNDKFVNDDKRCKITTLGHKIVFAVSGIDAMGGASVVRQGENKWEASSIARDQYASLAKTERPVDLGDLSTRWGDAMIKQMTTHSVLNSRILELNPDPTITKGLFAAFDRSGHLRIATVSISYERQGSYARLVGKVVQIQPSLGFLGRGEFIDEFLQNTTARARQWNHDFGLATVNLSKGGKFSALPAWLVDLTIKNDPGVDLPDGERFAVVGGEVDAVRLTRNGIGWIQRKHNCPL